MAADVVPGVAQVMEANVVGCSFEGCVDVGRCDCFPWAAGGLSVVGKGCAGRALVETNQTLQASLHIASSLLEASSSSNGMRAALN